MRLKFQSSRTDETVYIVWHFVGVGARHIDVIDTDPSRALFNALSLYFMSDLQDKYDTNVVTVDAAWHLRDG